MSFKKVAALAAVAALALSGCA
ncbi:MAG: hypothetical protein RL670_1161, partial [Actinomycetota bacterium]